AAAQIDRSHAQVDEKKFLTLVPIFENLWVFDNTVHAAVASGRHLERAHRIYAAGNCRSVVDNTHIDCRQHGAVHFVFDALLEGASKSAAAAESLSKAQTQ